MAVIIGIERATVDLTRDTKSFGPENEQIDASDYIGKRLLNPSVTIAIPVLNEEKYIEKVVCNFLNNTYANIIEILVADGGSLDGTRNIVSDLAKKDGRVKLLNNEKMVQSSALNLMIKEAKGEIFIRADAHCEYDLHYVERSVEVLLTTKAHNVGGAQRFVAENLVQAGVAIAVRSYLGSGGAKYRNPDYSGYADTVFLGSYYSDELRQIYGFREENRTNEDAELNLRLLEKFDKAIYVDSKICSWYYPRRSLISLWKQYFWYGWGRHLTLRNHTRSTPIRGRIPFWAISILLIYIFTDLFFPWKLYTAWIATAILCLYFIESIRVNIIMVPAFMSDIWRGDTGEYPSFFTRIILVFLVFIIMQTAHFVGYVYQFFKKN